MQLAGAVLPLKQAVAAIHANQSSAKLGVQGSVGVPKANRCSRVPSVLPGVHVSGVYK
jgi:hypothetical protein